MTAYLILLLAAASRCLPHWMHSVGVGMTMSGAGLLFFGSRIGHSKDIRARWQTLLAVALYAATDYYLTVYAYGYPFHVSGYFITWVWYAAVVLFAAQTLGTRRTPARIAVGALFSATGFFLWSNALICFTGTMYPHSLSGLLQSYIAGLPFYGNDLICTGLFSALFFSAAYFVELHQQHRALATR